MIKLLEKKNSLLSTERRRRARVRLRGVRQVDSATQRPRPAAAGVAQWRHHERRGRAEAQLANALPQVQVSRTRAERRREVAWLRGVAERE